MKQLLLLRHGRTVANERKTYCGWTDSPLSEAGREALTQRRWGCRYPQLTGFAVYTSGLVRTEQTLELLYGTVAHTQEPDFREMHFGVFEDRTYEEMREDPAYLAWITGDNAGNVCPGGESSVQMTARAVAALERALARDDRVCVVCHGGVIAALMAHLFPGEEKNLWQWQPDNGCGYLVSWGADGPRYTAVPFCRPDWEGKRYSFVQHRDCEFFPCHPGIPEADFNCLFCYCPLYALGKSCGGNCQFTKDGVKDCTGCTLPHKRNSYGYVNRRFAELVELAKQRR